MTDRDYMSRAIELAKHGIGWTSPNPVVGAVIVKDGRIIGEGYHRRCGEPHAERNAIASLKESAAGASLYVTLEPCCHYGRTPPCTEAILEQGIARVVIGSRDPNPEVAGKGAAILRKAGIWVEEDFMREECDRLNSIFFHYITKKTPYVVMKYAMTADGKIATRTGASKWITGDAARAKVQKLRHRCMGIMAGIGTVLADDPMLNVRIEGGKSPIRIICDSDLRIPSDSQICRTVKEFPTIVACAAARLKDREEEILRLERLGIQVVQTFGGESAVDLKELMGILGNQGIDSILLEGGGTLNDSALQAGIVSEIQAFVAPKLFGGNEAKTPVAGRGVNFPDEAVPLTLEKISQVGEDLLLEYKVCQDAENI
ncbi:MAG: bifunctional diaminohydroxyphosphoribosylaminopyrimidine deaminase/5-amino-6-(5-phosphoribosylamino)uracil reductase RibD [Dorea sp.]|nr:bifunctional diaminohydroxyphosphoribosylaminopyrimidine deaminase/5-amino-6-(5-phosphoribosylamino)uracil reductase RibD [Dorea sp.]